ncbi:DUF1385 domain-containing protein [Brevibacillus centrosporus]|uniref:DUF1385 domain-containing protein n=1 Tax=Brevibacillus centrosporus TaxID=54910 RepID=UPI003D1E6999
MILMDINGGRAHLNGVSFFTDHYVSVAKVVNNKISSDLKQKEPVQYRWIHALQNIPFVRGIAIILESALHSGNLLRILVVINTLLIGGNVYLASIGLYKNITFPPIVVLAVFVSALLFVKLTPFAKYHGAEHQTYNAYKQGVELTIENVRRMSRVSHMCGTNLVVFSLLAYFVISSLLNIHYALALIMSVSIGYEFFRLDHKLIILKPLYFLGAFVQQFLVTAEPSERQLEAAIVALKEVRDLP